MSFGQIITSCLEIESFLNFFNFLFSLFKFRSDVLQSRSITFIINKKWWILTNFEDFLICNLINFDYLPMLLWYYSIIGGAWRLFLWCHPIHPQFFLHGCLRIWVCWNKIRRSDFMAYSAVKFIICAYSGFSRSFFPFSIRSFTGNLLVSNCVRDFSCLSINSSTFSKKK